MTTKQEWIDLLNMEMIFETACESQREFLNAAIEASEGREDTDPLNEEIIHINKLLGLVGKPEFKQSFIDNLSASLLTNMNDYEFRVLQDSNKVREKATQLVSKSLSDLAAEMNARLFN